MKATASAQIRSKLGVMRRPMSYAEFTTIPQCSQRYANECIRAHARPGQYFARVKLWWLTRPITIVFPPDWELHQVRAWCGEDHVSNLWIEYDQR